MKNLLAFPNPNRTDQTGMNLRDYFAAQAMQGWIAGTDHTRPFDYSRLASFAYEIADAMMKEREA